MSVVPRSLTLLLVLSPIAAADDTIAVQKYKALVAEYEQAGGARAFADRFVKFADQYEQEPIAADALLWVVNKVRGKAVTAEALKKLSQHHVHRRRLGPSCEVIAKSRSIGAEQLLLTILEKNPDKQVRALAGYFVAHLLKQEANLVDQLKAEPSLAPRVLQYYGKEYGEHLSSLKPAQLTAKRERALERLQKSFPNVKMEESTMGSFATKELFAIRNLAVGRVAPDITGEDVAGKPFKLSDFRGKVVLLTFWGHW